MNLFVGLRGEVIATGSEVLSLGHCAVPFLFRALSDWASERFPIEIIMRLNWDFVYSPLAFIQQSMTLFVMDTTLQKSFGMRCKELRAGLGCSQEQFANLIEMDRSYYASIEVGRRNVSLSNLKKIADGFQISIAELMRGVS